MTTLRRPCNVNCVFNVNETKHIYIDFLYLYINIIYFLSLALFFSINIYTNINSHIFLSLLTPLLNECLFFE